MKLPSLSLLANAARITVTRFPFALLSALVGVVLIISMVHGKFAQPTQDVLTKLTVVASLGLPLFFAIHIFCERQRALPMYKFIAIVVGLGLLVQFYYGINSFRTMESETIYRLFFWSAGLHLIVAFSAFFIEEEINGFWQFNKLLFLRFLTAALYSGVIYLGLAGALLAIQELFNLRIHGEYYFDLWVIIAGLFNTIFFLGGITELVEQLNTETSYPKGLKVFTQYVLIPLVTIYLLILYAYVIKICVQMNLPKGWVANLILAFSVVGILALLLVYPVREEEENKWIKTYSRVYYYSLVPLVILLFVAINKRISDYGFTIERYIVLMLGIWLSVITLYFIFSKRKNIILIPLTLAIFLFGSCFGPWGMFQVSENSQLRRLQLVLEKNHAFVNGKIVTLTADQAKNVKYEDVEKVNSILDYLSRYHGFEGMKDWLDKDCQNKVFRDSSRYARYDQVNVIRNCMGIWSTSIYETDEDKHLIRLDYSCNQFSVEEGVSVNGYDKLYSFRAYKGGSDYDSLSGNFTRTFDTRMKFYTKGTLLLNTDLGDFIRKLHGSEKEIYSSQVKPSEMTIDVDGENGIKARLLFSRISCLKDDSTLTLNSIDGYILIRNR